MTTSSEKADLGRRVRRYDKWIMVTGVAMFLLSFAPWEGLEPETIGNLGGLGLSGVGNVPSPQVRSSRLACGLRGWLPCLVALAIAGAVAVHDFFGVQVPGVAGTRPRFLLQVAAAISVLPLSIRAISLRAAQPECRAGAMGCVPRLHRRCHSVAFVIRGRKRSGTSPPLLA